MIKYNVERVVIKLITCVYKIILSPALKIGCLEKVELWKVLMIMKNNVLNMI